jgi:hypothetical protein
MSVGAIVVAAIIVLIVNHLARLIQTMMLHRTVRAALNRDSAVGPELLDRLREPKSAFGSDDRLGVILIALSAAMIAFGLLQGSGGASREVASASVFPLFVGVVLVGRHILVRTREAGR